MKLTDMTPKEILKKAKELKNHLKFINKEDSTIDWTDNYLDPKDCFYSSQISQKPN